MLFAEDLARVGWRCIRFAPAGDLTAELRRDLAARGAVCFEMAGSDIGGKAQLMDRLAAALGLPAHFGRNWDAVIDCLRDLPDRVPAGAPANAYVLFVLDGLALWRADPALAGALVETWLVAAEEFGHDGIALHLVFLDGPAASGLG
jgi:hypothetical protein